MTPFLILFRFNLAHFLFLEFSIFLLWISRYFLFEKSASSSMPSICAYRLCFFPFDFRSKGSAIILPIWKYSLFILLAFPTFPFGLITSRSLFIIFVFPKEFLYFERVFAYSSSWNVVSSSLLGAFLRIPPHFFNDFSLSACLSFLAFRDSRMGLHFSAFLDSIWESISLSACEITLISFMAVVFYYIHFIYLYWIYFKLMRNVFLGFCFIFLIFFGNFKEKPFILWNINHRK